VLKESNVDLIDLEGRIRRHVSLDFSVCPVCVSGHFVHGLVEAKIKIAQTGFQLSGAGNTRLHATGAQTLAKLIENDMNNTPFGVTCGRSESNSPLLKLLTPNMMKVGRIHSRNSIGPFKLPTAPKSMLDRVQDCYKMWFREYQDTLLFKYLLDLQPKWFKSSRDTKIGDCVYFRKTEGKLEGSWQLGLVNDYVKSKDGEIRRVEILYHNASESCSRTTDRSIRSVVKLFNPDDGSWKQDMDKVEQMLRNCGVPVTVEAHSEEAESTAAPSHTLSGENVSFDTSVLLDDPRQIDDEPVSLQCKNVTCSNCCCASHHRFCYHGPRSTTYLLEQNFGAEQTVLGVATFP